jgi:3-hydroxybutyryl-CoA dehydrogenase
MTETPKDTYAVVGSGYMGGGIAQSLALAGATVMLADVTHEVALANYNRLVTEAHAFEADGLFPAGSGNLIEARLWPAPSIEVAVQNATFIEEAVPEVLAFKHDALKRISAAARPDAIIGSNTSTISIATLAEAVTAPERFLGVHFSNPAPFIPGVELIPHANTSPEAIARVEDIVASAGRQSATVKDVTGFVLNRLQYALFHEATQLVEEGVATAEDIDTIARTTFGFRLPFFGPFAIADMAGLDVYEFCYRSLQTDFPERFATPPILTKLVAEGRLGTKSGGGFIDLPADRIPALIEYRNRAYVKMRELLDDLGPAPID